MVVDAFAERHDAAGGHPKLTGPGFIATARRMGARLRPHDRKLIASGRRRHVAVV
ncbi:MAG: hypothetical protein ABSF98_22800 [Bryobacteraceae bacterium]